MHENIIGDEKAKFIINYSKLGNELNDFLSLNQKANGATIKTATYNSKNQMNLMLNEKIKNKNSKEIIKSIFSNEKNILDKNIFSEDFVKKEKWEKLKNSINPLKSSKNGENNSNSVFDRIKNNLNKMKKELTLEEAFQKNTESLNDLNIISPRNNIMNNNIAAGRNYNSSNSDYIDFKGVSESERNGNVVKDFALVNTLNNSKNINTSLKQKFNQFYLKQSDVELNYHCDVKESKIDK